MRVLLQPALGFGDADAFQKLQSAGGGLRLRQVLVQHEAVGQLALDGEDRVQRGHRLLKDHPDLVAAHFAHHGGGGGGDVKLGAIRPAEAKRARGDGAAAEFHQSHEGEGGHGLPRPAFTDDADGFAWRDGEGHVLDPDDGAAVGSKFDAEVID